MFERALPAHDRPRPRQGKALSSSFPFESEAICIGGLAESQSVTIAAQTMDHCPPKLGRSDTEVALKLSFP
jgi:hypothetical protein